MSTRVGVLGLVLLLLSVATPASANPAGGPLCFVDATYGATWHLETVDVTPAHWLVVGDVRLPALTYPIAAFGSGVTSEVATTIMLSTTLYGAVASVTINLGSEAAWWPGANAWFSLFYPHEDHTDGWAYYSLVPNVPLTKVACP